MKVSKRIEVLTEQRSDGTIRVRAPSVGWWLAPPEAGSLIGRGGAFGWLEVLGQAAELHLPADVAGIVARSEDFSEVRERRLAVSYGQVLGSLSPLETMSAPEEAAAPSPSPSVGLDGGSVFRAPSSGRFYRAARPGEPPLATEGQILASGAPFGLLEVMKTFTPLLYAGPQATVGRARVIRFIAQDGEDLTEGQAIVELEPA